MAPKTRDVSELPDRTVQEMRVGWQRVLQADARHVPSDEVMERRIRKQYIMVRLQLNRVIVCNVNLTSFRSFDPTIMVEIMVVRSDWKFRESAAVFPTDELIANVLVAVEFS